MRVNPFDKYLKPEDRLQIAVIRYIKYKYPSVKIHHSPNEGKRTKFEQYLFLQLGCSRGFPDLTLFYKKCNMALELKAGKNTPTSSQIEWLDNLESNGWYSVWCNTFESACKEIDNFISLANGKESEESEENKIKAAKLGKGNEKGRSSRARPLFED